MPAAPQRRAVRSHDQIRKSATLLASQVSDRPRGARPMILGDRTEERRENGDDEPCCPVVASSLDEARTLLPAEPP